MSPARARSWRTFGAIAIWCGVLACLAMLALAFLDGLGELGNYDCGSACEARQAATAERHHVYKLLAMFVAAPLSVAGVIIRMRVPDPDAAS